MRHARTDHTTGTALVRLLLSLYMGSDHRNPPTYATSFFIKPLLLHLFLLTRIIHDEILGENGSNPEGLVIFPVPKDPRKCTALLGGPNPRYPVRWVYYQLLEGWGG